jgi:fructosamine-3-kinase
MLDAEADGLRALAATGAIRVPQPIADGVAGSIAYLALEWLDFGGGGRDALLGRALAELHRKTGPRFGWHRDNTIGTSAQANAWSDDWPTFFRDRRLAPQFARAAANGHGGAFARSGDRLLLGVPTLLAGHSPVPSLLHGDLWSGNAARLASGEPVIFDPAVYYGDREADLAMSELFGGFGADFHAAYRDAWPLTAGYATRRTLYNLYHVLNHLNLFGAGYRAQAESMVGALLAENG